MPFRNWLGAGAGPSTVPAADNKLRLAAWQAESRSAAGGADLRVAEPERQAGEEKRSDGPGGEHAEALPGGERKGADIGRGLDVQTCSHRGDLFQVPPPGPG